MRTRPLIGVVGAFVSVGLLLTGCADGDDATSRTKATSSSTPVTIPSPDPTVVTAPLDRASVRDVEFNAYSEGVYKSAEDCGCSLRDADLGVDVPDLFPRGTAVWLVRFTVEGLWSPSQADGRRDVTGTTMTAKFQDRPEAAVIDAKEGPEKAKQLGIPWELKGLFGKSSTWTVVKDEPRSFLVAFHVPEGSTDLDVTFDVPSEPFPTEMHLAVPERARALAAGDAHDH